MPQRVYNNVEDYRLLDGGRVVEDVTKVGLPTITFPTTTISVSGMAADIDMPTTTHLEAMDFTVYHNNGINGSLLSRPGKHEIEFRLARQVYNTAQTEMGHSGSKYRVTCIHVETQKGDVETGSPLGSTEKFSVIRFEEIVSGKTKLLIDAASNIIQVDGTDYTSKVKNMLE